MTSTHQPLDGPALARAIDRLASIDADVAAVVARIGYPIPRLRPPGFATLLRIMVSQQVSTRSAVAIWGRLEAALGEPAPERYLALDAQALRAVGLSGRKIEYGQGLATAVSTGALDLDGLATLPHEDAIAELCSLKGFGRWSAEIYLLFALSRTDSWPADDLALQVGMQRLKGLSERPDRKAMDALAEAWRPLRGCGAILLWHVYGAATLDG
ncbi:MAG: DNA-3-methyladenine glycosylase 2 family protein [Alphaproteobacteria bacterium]|nr:DNA-3-methyladenine glycosylase 2 family protein [Alphaproteobacteria bacterium]